MTVQNILQTPSLGEGWGGLFEEEISIYAHARDAVGTYQEQRVDYDTGEVTYSPIKQMTIRDFCLSDRFKPTVMKLRQMQAQYGKDAKNMPEYDTLKKSLPAATLSGLFSYRRQADLVRHSGYIVLDMDWQDNRTNAMWGMMKELFFPQYPEIALAMRSCSGTGYFALVPLAYPEQHKAQARAIMELYKSRGITLDVSCKDPTRLRFASWDDTPYVNPNAIAFTGIDNNEPLQPKRFNHERTRTDTNVNPDARLRYIENLLAKLEATHTDITHGYENWIKVGWSLKEFGDYGRRLFHRVSAINPEYKSGDTDRKWAQLGDNQTITSNYFIHQAKQALCMI